MPHPFRSLGDFHDLTDLGDRLLLTAQRGALEITPLPDHLLRVRIGRRKKLPAYHSLTVNADELNRRASRGSNRPSAVQYKLEPSETGFHLHSGKLITHVQFQPLLISFAHTRRAAFATDLALGVRAEHVVAHKALQPGEHVYGLGEKTGWLDKRHRRYRMRNTDVGLEHPAGIGNVTDPMYASFPVFIVHSARGSYGIFVDNTEFTEFDFTQADHYQFSAPAETLTYYLLPGPTLPDVLRQYTSLTGRIQLPALWALGYHQCRWGYATEADIRQVAAELRARNIPADGIWFDIDYMDGYRVFTWDQGDFPRPAQLTTDLGAQGFRVVTIIDPGVKVDKRYAVYREGQRGGHFVRHPNGKEYNGSVWPGRSAFPDFHRAETRQWWAGLVRRWMADYGVAGIWNDMNEPASTDVAGPIMEARHADGQLPHASARNTYALQMARATYEGMLAHDPDSRPFILTRAAFSGAQAVTALWCGDNSPQWEHLAASLPMLMNLGLSGMPFVGVDLGGFGGDTNGELLARWTQAGVFYPFCRNHATTGANAHEPWAFGPEVEAICRKSIELRYQLLPYLYNLFHEAAQTGAPIIRPLVWHYPDDPATFNLNDQFMLGPDLLVAPVLAPGLTARAVYLPQGQWRRWQRQGLPVRGPTHIIADAPLDELPLFVRAGAILPLWPVAQHTGAINRTEVSLHLWPGDGQLDFYEDDGETRAYERGDDGWRSTRFKMKMTDKGLSLAWGKPQGRYTAGRSHWTFVIHSLPNAAAKLDGQPVSVRRVEGALAVRVRDDGRRHTLIVQS
jgi:alpha-glucosidase